MKLLHTSDWHVGKKIRGASRADEHRAVLAEIVDLAIEHDVDAVLIAGDLFETAAPTPESEQIVYQTLLGFAEAGAHVFVVSGNHDNARRLGALRALLELGRIHLVAEITKPDDGGVLTVDVDGVPLVVAALPFVSQQRIVRATDLMEAAAFEHTGAYAEKLAALIHALSAHFAADSVNVMLAHAFVQGGAIGGGERSAHVIEDYAVSAQAFPATATYVALGHLHKTQKVPGATAIHYSGSPLQLDFGEQNQAKHVNLITATPGAPAKVKKLRLSAGLPLRTLRGDLASLRKEAATVDDAWLRVVVQESRRADLAEEIRELFGERVVDVVIESTEKPKTAARTPRSGRTPTELFREYLTEREINDPAIEALFAELLDSVT